MTVFIVNGKKVEVNEPLDTPLLWVLRESLDLTGTKYSCGIGSCGSCAVIIEGTELVKSCVVTLADVAGKNIETIEASGKDDVLGLVQKAWINQDVPECGYCQSGQVMAATVLLRKNLNPCTKDIIEAMSGNICRCGTYNRIVDAIKSVSNKIQEKGCA